MLVDSFVRRFVPKSTKLAIPVGDCLVQRYISINTTKPSDIELEGDSGALGRELPGLAGFEVMSRWCDESDLGVLFGSGAERSGEL